MPAPKQMVGSRAEDLAEGYLRAKGFQILERNWLCKVGELDIVAMDGTTLVFVEVKAFEFGLQGTDPLANVTYSKQKKLIKAARTYLAKLNREPDCRFDVVSVRLTKEPSLEHFEGAFTE